MPPKTDTATLRDGKIACVVVTEVPGDGGAGPPGAVGSRNPVARVGVPVSFGKPARFRGPDGNPLALSRPE